MPARGFAVRRHCAGCALCENPGGRGMRMFSVKALTHSELVSRTDSPGGKVLLGVCSHMRWSQPPSLSLIRLGVPVGLVGLFAPVWVVPATMWSFVRTI